MAKLIFALFIAVNLIWANLAQDFEPDPLEDPKKTTTTTTTTPSHIHTDAATSGPITKKPATNTPTTTTTTTNRTPVTTDSPYTTSTSKSTTTTTESSETTKPTTEPSTPPTTTLTTPNPPTSTTALPTTTPSAPSTTPKPDHPWYPWYPLNPSSQCYYKTQQGFPHLKWFCGRLQYVTPIECYRCCLYQYDFFAGCYKVSYHLCDSSSDTYNFGYGK